MSADSAGDEGVFGTFPYEAVITPATIAGLVVGLSQYLLGVAIGANLFTTITPAISNLRVTLSVEWLAVTLIHSIAVIGLFVAILAIVVSGARTDVLLVGAILTYVAGLLSILLTSVYIGGGLALTFGLLLSPLSPVLIAVGVGIGVNWIGVEVAVLD